MTNRPPVFLSNTGLPISARPQTAAFVGAATETGTVDQQLANQETPTTTTPPGSLALNTGTLFNTAYVDAAWTTVGGEGVREFEVRTERDGVGIVSITRTSNTSIRIEPVISGSTYTVFVYNVMLSGAFGTWSSGTITAALDTTIPATPSTLSAGAGLRTLTADWTDNTEPDVAFGVGRYRVQVATDSGFTALIYDKDISGTVVSVTDLSPATQYWIRVSAKDTSNNQSPFTASATVTTIQAGYLDLGIDSVRNNHIQDFAVDTAQIHDAAITNAQIGLLAVKTGNIFDAAITNAQIKNLAVDDAKIAVATITGAKIKTAEITDAHINSLQAGKITTGTITSQTITLAGTGVFKSSGYPTTGFSLTGAGDFVAKSGTFIGTITGSTITGSTFETASSGLRTVITSDHRISFYNSIGNLSQELRYDSGSGWFLIGTGSTIAATQIKGEYIILQSIAGDVKINHGGSITVLTSKTSGIVSYEGGADGGAFVGEVFSTSYVGLKTGNMSGSEYMIMSNGGDTFISGGAGGASHLRSGNNGGTGGADQVRVSSDLITLQINSVTKATANTAGFGCARVATTSATGYADAGLGLFGTYSSRRVLKNNIRPVVANAAVNRIKALEPVEFEFRPEIIGNGKNPMVAFNTQRGFVAEDVAAVDKNLAVYDWLDPDNPDFIHPLPEVPEGESYEEWITAHFDLADTVPTMWDEHAMIADLVATAQELIRRVEILER